MKEKTKISILSIITLIITGTALASGLLVLETSYLEMEDYNIALTEDTQATIERYDNGLKFDGNWINETTTGEKNMAVLEYSQASNPIMKLQTLSTGEFEFEMTVDEWIEDEDLSLVVEDQEGNLIFSSDEGPTDIQWSYQSESVGAELDLKAEGNFIAASWQHDGSSTDGYRLYRNTTDDPDTDIDNTDEWTVAETLETDEGDDILFGSIKEFNVRDTDVEPEQLYCYRITAFSDSGESTPVPENPEEACTTV